MEKIKQIPKEQYDTVLMFVGQDSAETRDRNLEFTGESNEKLKAFAENAKDKKKKTILVM